MNDLPPAGVPRDAKGAVNDPVNAAVSRALAVGSLASAAILAAGLVTWVLLGARPAGARTLPEWIGRLGDLDPAAIVFLGLLAVTLTPVGQLLAALAAFSRRREWRDAAIAASVLAIVVGSAVLAVAVS